MAAVLLDVDLGGDDLETLGDLDVHLPEHAAALRAGALALGDVVLDHDGLEPVVVDVDLAAAPVGLSLPLGQRVLDGRLGVLLVEGCLHLVEQRDLAVGDLLGLGAVEAHVPELDLLDQGGLLELGLGELGLQRGDDLVGLGGLGAQVLAEVGDLLGERVVLGDEGRDLPLHALQQLAHGL